MEPLQKMHTTAWWLVNQFSGESMPTWCVMPSKPMGSGGAQQKFCPSICIAISQRSDIIYTPKKTLQISRPKAMTKYYPVNTHR
jgi:hypothetical protein